MSALHVFHYKIKRCPDDMQQNYIFDLYIAIVISFSIAVAISRSIIVVTIAIVIALYRAKKKPGTI